MTCLSKQWFIFNYILYIATTTFTFKFFFCHFNKTLPAIFLSFLIVSFVLFSGAVIIATSKQLLVGSFLSMFFQNSIKFFIMSFALTALSKRTFITF